MTQNRISLTLTDADFTEIDQALATLEGKLSGLIDLQTTERRAMPKMGQKSEAFCRQTLKVLEQNPKMIPGSMDLADAQKDLAHLDALRGRAIRFKQLAGRLDDSELALGSDVMAFSLEGYALLKMLGKGSGLTELRQGISARFSKSPRQIKEEELPGL